MPRAIAAKQAARQAALAPRQHATHKRMPRKRKVWRKKGDVMVTDADVPQPLAKATAVLGEKPEERLEVLRDRMARFTEKATADAGGSVSPRVDSGQATAATGAKTKRPRSPKSSGTDAAAFDQLDSLDLVLYRVVTKIMLLLLLRLWQN